MSAAVAGLPWPAAGPRLRAVLSPLCRYQRRYIYSLHYLHYLHYLYLVQHQNVLQLQLEGLLLLQQRLLQGDRVQAAGAVPV